MGEEGDLPGLNPPGCQGECSVVLADEEMEKSLEGNRVIPIQGRGKRGCKGEVEIGKKAEKKESPAEGKETQGDPPPGKSQEIEQGNAGKEEEDGMVMGSCQPHDEGKEEEDFHLLLRASLPKAGHHEEEQGGEEVVEGKDFGHKGVEPEDGGEGQGEGCEERSPEGPGALEDGQREKGQRCSVEERREEVHLESHTAHRKECKELSQQCVEGISGWMRDSQSVCHGDQLAAIPCRKGRAKGD